MKVLFLINNGFGIGGTITTTFNLAGGLARRGHDVEVLSTLRHRDVPQLPLDPAVRLTALVETRTGHPDHDPDDPLRGGRARFYPRADYRADDYDRMIEVRYERHLRATDADVVIATRAGLIAYLGRFGPQRLIRVGQEHLTRRQQRRAMRRQLPRHIARLDAFVTVTRHDAEDYRRHLRLRDTELLFIPNSVPAPTVAPSTGAARIVVAAGRLVPGKRYDLLIRGFARVAARHPDWQLRIYGYGRLKDELRRLVSELGLHNNVLMMGAYTPIETEWSKGAIAAVPSDREPFGMTLVEAMRCGVPVVSTDAPHGPAEILDDGVDGLLTPVGDVDAMAAALLRLIGDPRQRRSMAAAALANSARYDPSPIAQRYEALFERLAARKARPRPRRLPLPWRRARATPPSPQQQDPHRPQELPQPQPRPALGPAPSVTLATACGEVTGAGEVLVRPGPAVGAGAALVWRRLGGGGPAEVAVTGRTAEGVTVRAGDLPEGAWQLRLRDGEPVHAAALDTRALIDPPDDRLVVQLPYRLADGGLAVRVWNRRAYAEVGDVTVDSAGIHLDVRVVGPVSGPPVLELRGPDGDREAPVERLPGDLLRAHVAPPGPGTWRPWLRVGGTALQLGRVRDDVARKNVAYVLPAPLVYEADNTLTIRVL